MRNSIVHAVALVRGLVARSVLAALLALLCAEGVVAQSANAPLPPFQQLDGNGVDLVGGGFTIALEEGSIGAGEARLNLMRYWDRGAWADDWSGGLYYQTSGGTTIYYVNIGPISDSFTLSGSTFVSRKANGATLQWTGSHYRYVSSSGTAITFQTTSDSGYPLQGYSCPSTAVGACYIPISIEKPNGMSYSIRWDIFEKCLPPVAPDCPAGGVGYFRFAGVDNRPGYSFSIHYLTDTPGTGTAPQTNWYKRTGVTFADPASACGSGCPSVTYSTSGPFTISDALGRTWQFTMGGGGIIGIRRPGASADTTTIAYGTNGVTNVTRDGVSWGYYRTISGSTSTMTVTDALSHVMVVTADISLGRIKTVQDQLSNITTYDYDANARLTQVTAPEGNRTTYHYDGRGNVDSITSVPKAGSPLPNIVTTAGYPAGCTNPVTCNQPEWTRDAGGNQTDYVYDSTTGLPTTITYPAPSSGGTRPQTRYSYTSVGGVALLNTTSACRTGASCAGTSNETKSVISYNSYVEPTAVSGGSGDGTSTPTATASYGYDAAGNVTSTTDPLGKITYAYYNAARQPVWVLTPDPDDAGTLKNRMTYIAYNGDGTVQNVQRGTANGDSSGFVQLQRVEYDYDPYGRKIRARLSSGSTLHARADYSYDDLGRGKCAAVRMNPGTAGTTDACSLSDGQDRITLQDYDWVGRSSQVTEGFGSGVSRPTVRNTYTANGKLATLTDAKDNVTTYEYDGFDRLQKTRYPNASGGGSSGSDYEQLTYGTSGATAGLMISRRLRDGNSVGYAYDLLGRVTTMTPPGYTGNDNPITYSYDNLGHTTQYADAASGHTTGLSYDALGRVVAENGPWRNKLMGYDLAGRLTSLNYGDGYWVRYYYDNLGEMTGIYENGSTWLASYGYDDLGRRIWTARANGVGSNLTYDGADRLTNLAHDLAGTSSDIAIGMSYNPAGQITQRTLSNDAYSWADAYNVNRSYATNGLNQYTNISSSSTITPTYDARGNLTSAGGLSYGYTNRNQLQSVSSGAYFYYDAMGRLDVDAGTGSCALLDNVGSNIDAELDCGTGATLRRYVYGPDNAPVVWYEGSGTSDKRWLLTDERGSVTAVTDGSGNAIRINTYDEYGIPATNNLGRFQYTGQAWLPSIGMYYYRARIYSPTLGRFVQTDPIGYGDGPNWYNYVGGDPVNSLDSSGLTTGSNIDYGAGICGSCSGNGVGAVYGSSTKDIDRSGNQLKSDQDQTGTWWRIKNEYDDGSVTYGAPYFVPNAIGGSILSLNGGAQNQVGEVFVTGRRPIPNGRTRQLDELDLGPSSNVVVLAGTIGIFDKQLRIRVNLLIANGNVTRQGIGTAVNTAISLGLSSVQFTATVQNDRLAQILADPILFRAYPGTEVIFKGREITINIPVPRSL